MLSVSETSPGKAKPADLILSIIYNPKNTTLPGVCSPVEAGEVARVAWRRGGDLPRGLRQRLRMTVYFDSRSDLRDRRATLAMTNNVCYYDNTVRRAADN